MKRHLELWGGPECTINRVRDTYQDQFERCGHYDRIDDLNLFADIGITTIRYPILWECIAPDRPGQHLWQGVDARIDRLRAHGIDCAACHEGEDGEMLGPWGIETDAHASAKNESFTTGGGNRLCIACHATNIGPVIGVAKDFNKTAVAKAGGSCVGCHMAPVERAHAIDPETGEAAPVREGRSHHLQTPRDPTFLRQAFRLEAMTRDDVTVVSITNRTGHRVPGLSLRTMEFRLELLDANGKTRAEVRHTIDKRRYLPVDEALEIELDGVGTTVHVLGDHDAPGYRLAVRFLDETLQITSGDE